LMLLVHATTPDAVAVVRELARSPGPQRLEALVALVQMDADDPASTRLVTDVLEKGRPQEVLLVTSALADAGAPIARTALLHALRGNDADALHVAPSPPTRGSYSAVTRE